MLELSAWARFCDTQPGAPEAFHSLRDEAKFKLTAASPLRICKHRFPDLVQYLESKGGFGEAWIDLVIIFGMIWNTFDIFW